MSKWIVILLIWVFHKQDFSTSGVNSWRHFSVLQKQFSENCFLVREIHISNVIPWLIIIICQRASFHFIPYFLEAGNAKVAQLPPQLNPKTLEKLIRVDCPTICDTIVGFSGDLFFNSGMNLHIGPNLFTFSLKSKCLYLFVKKVELTKYLKISL